jgi:protein-disulfide isomerase
MNRQERRHGHAQKKSKAWLWWTLLAVVIIAIIGGIYYNYSKGTGLDYTLYQYTDDVYAAPDATHTVEEFSDFECPYCQDFAPTFHAVREAYKGKVNFVYKQFPLRTIHPQAQPAAEAAECAREQNHFWAYHDVLFDSKKIDKRSLKLHAQGIGLDMGAWESCFEDGRGKPAVQADILEGNQRGVQGTPTIFVDGKVFGGRNVADFSAVLQ